MNQASKAFCILLVWYLKKIDWVIILVIWDIYYYYSYSLEPKEPNQHVGTMRRRPHQYTSACIWLWCTFVVFWLARYIFWYLCMQLQCVAVRILAHNSSSSNSSSCCLYIVKKGVWTSDKLSQLMLLECGRLEHKLLVGAI